ncbi:hypothetical protein NQ317_011208 [Molorchus minor]|uniref:DNA-directed RNA polymerase III subunit RPC3 n=1 Tax=Molorchus minor TaxID=1323400 RepID=A0ABQ9JSD0_9CUCU|nr:hypothetical protein NQ317_011208 [Molorchus minor]
MSVQLRKVISLILLERFGPVVEKSSYYRLVKFLPNKNESVANYSLDPGKVLLMLRYPKYINLIKKKFGDESEMIVEELLLRGYWTASELILRVYERLSKNVENAVTLGQLKEKIISLVTAKYVMRVPYSEEDSPVPSLQIKDKDLHAIPNIDIKTAN